MVTRNTRSLQDVKNFWESYPLFCDESSFPPGNKGFFEEHCSVYIRDCFAGTLDARLFPVPPDDEKVLDLGCGPGFWAVELARHGAKHVVAADLTQRALELTKQRCHAYGLSVEVCEQNAERMTFADGSFTHVNCQGVIHHTPNPEAVIAEISRVLRSRGTAMLSVYYKNIYLRAWPLLRHVGLVIDRLGGGLRGRGREHIYRMRDAAELVRRYDGAENPIGMAFSKEEFSHMLSKHLTIEDMFLHFFPARSLPFPIPRVVHTYLDATTGFLIYARCRK